MFVASLIFLLVLMFGVLIYILKRIITQNVVRATKHLEELDEDYTKKLETIDPDEVASAMSALMESILITEI